MRIVRFALLLWATVGLLAAVAVAQPPRRGAAPRGGAQRRSPAPRTARNDPRRADVRRARPVEAQWIWSSEAVAAGKLDGACYFRKTFDVSDPVDGRISLACDDRYDLYVNGRKIGSGREWRTLDTYDITAALVAGRNAVAIRGDNARGDTAALVARVIVRTAGGTEVSHSTDADWKTSLREQSGWTRALFNDSRWAAAHAFGDFGRTEPWNDEVKAGNGGAVGRFLHGKQFRVDRVAHPDDTGSLLAMTFNEWGQIVASREGGGLELITDDDQDGEPEAVAEYCSEVKNCQGMLALNGHVFAVGEGADGPGLYRISDADQDGRADSVGLLLKFKGAMSEHGAHCPVLGPDGLIYLMVGNHASIDAEYSPSSPVRTFYEGDLIQPKYEDAGGHAVGVKAPGGVVLRTDLEGSFVELHASGLRNAYDIAFNRQGELFTFDSDMEWDEGLPWYRPTRILHLTPGAEFGWRSGWSKWPEYYLDSLPATMNVGRGSPTGVEFYNHDKYPPRYRNALFACDWSQGRIIALMFESAGGSYVCGGEIFLQGQPLNVTDIAVGPDGWLYFCTGGRGTEGGLYRVVYTGDAGRQEYDGIQQAIRQPQLYSAFGRERIAAIKEQLGADWDDDVQAFALEQTATVDDRMRALDLMQLFGPSPKSALLIEVSRDQSAELRGKAADLMGLHFDASTSERSIELLDDDEPLVRRKACEALLRARQPAPVEKLLALLADEDRFVAFAARRTLEAQPLDTWRQKVLETLEPRVFLLGATALLTASPDRDTATAVLARASQALTGFMTDDDFLDLLRVMQLALIRGQVPPEDATPLRDQLAEEYPSLEPRINRELIRLLVHLQATSVTDRFFAELRGNAPPEEKIHLATHLRFLAADWTQSQELELLKFFESARAEEGGYSYALYLANFSRDFVGTLPAEDQQMVLDNALRVPTAALSALAALAETPSPALLQRLTQLDRQLKALDGDAARQLAVGIEAVLGESGDADGMAYLREVFEQQPERRKTVAMALAQDPSGENWPLLMQSLPILDAPAAQEVVAQLLKSERASDEPEHLRQIILSGLKMGDDGGDSAVALLEQWTGEAVGSPDDETAEALAAWQQWFAVAYPDAPEPTLPEDAEDSRHTFADLLKLLTEDKSIVGDAARGRQVFEKAQCAKCHRFGGRGEGIGPDLSTVARRFQTKEILESILFPSQIISDQYASKTVVTTDGFSYTGLVARGNDGAYIVLQSNGQKQIVAEDEVDEIAPAKKSSMPEGLLNNLTPEEIADMLAFLKGT